ncbi:MAG: hypothetical protein P0S95_02875 [Rhabdochlamydiaceae bacterium]|nr:hypothetical protein [Candidatus Amphrikana amoebophyrae]
MKKLISIIGVIVILFSLLWFREDLEKDKKWRMSDKAVSRFVKKVKKEHHFKLVGKGGSEENDKIKSISLTFSSIKEFRINELPEARKLLLSLTSSLLESINSSPDLKPFLFQYPFSKEDIKISILSDLPIEDGDEYLVYLQIYNGRLTYCKECEDRMGPFIKVLGESYEEALKKDGLNSIDVK